MFSVFHTLISQHFDGPYEAHGPSAAPPEASGPHDGPIKVHGPRGHCSPLPPFRIGPGYLSNQLYYAPTPLLNCLYCSAIQALNLVCILA